MILQVEDFTVEEGVRVGLGSDLSVDIGIDYDGSESVGIQIRKSVGIRICGNSSAIAKIFVVFRVMMMTAEIVFVILVAAVELVLWNGNKEKTV